MRSGGGDTSDRERYIIWLQAQSDSVATQITFRLVLRVLPFVVNAFDRKYPYADKFCLAILRTYGTLAAFLDVDGVGSEVILSSVKGAKSVRENFIVRAQNSGGSLARLVAPGATATAKIAHIAALAGEGFALGEKGAIFPLLDSVVYEASQISNREIWRSIQSDIDFLEKSGSAGDLMGRPLLLANDAFSDECLTFWRRLMETLETRAQHWDIWISWYNRFLVGLKTSAIFNTAILSLSNDEWSLEPAKVNMRLKQLVGQLQNESEEDDEQTINASDTTVVSAANRLVSSKHNQSSEKQDSEEIVQQATIELEKYFIRDQNNLRFHLPYYDEFLGILKPSKKTT